MARTAEAHDRVVERPPVFIERNGGMEGTFPAGTYAVEETREPVEGLSFIGYRRTKTTIELPSSNAAYVARQLVEVEPADLEAALATDAETSHVQP